MALEPYEDRPMIRMQMDQGPPKRRPASSQPLQCYGGSVTLTDAQWNILAGFSDAVGQSSFFAAEPGNPEERVLMRFREQPRQEQVSVNPQATTQHRVRIDLAKNPLQP